MLTHFFGNYMSPNGFACIQANLFYALGTAILLNEIQFTVRGILRTFVKVIVACGIVITIAILYYWLYPKSLNGYFTTAALFMICAVLVFRHYSLSTRIIWGSICATTWIFSASVLAPFMLFFVKGIGWIVMVVRGIILIAVVIYLKSQPLEKYVFKNIYFMVLMEGICAIGFTIEFTNIFIFKFMSMVNTAPYIFWEDFVICSGLVFIELLSYTMFRKLIMERANNLDLNLQQQRMESQNEMMALFEKNYEDARLFRHDIKNQYAYIQALLEENEYEKAADYFRQFSEKSFKFLNSVSCGNKAMDIIMNLEIAKARKAGVTVNTKLQVPPKLSIPDNEICSILTNLMDNAIEACEAVKPDRAAVSIRIRQQNNLLSIHMENPMPPGKSRQEILRLQTKKENRDLHGYGTKIIANLTEKYDGCVKYDVIDSLFISDVILMLNEHVPETQRERITVE